MAHKFVSITEIRIQTRLNAQGLTFEQTNQVTLAGFLQGTNGSRLEAQISLEVLGDLANKTLERELANQELGRLLVTADLTKSNSSRAIT